MSLHILLYEAGGFPVLSDEADANPLYCASIKYSEKEIFRSPVASNKKWNNRSTHPLDEIFDSKEREKYRPFCYEFLHVDIFEYKRNVIEKYGESYIDLTDAPIVQPSNASSLTSLAVHYESAKMYKVLKIGSNILENESQLGYIKIALFIVPEDMDEYNSFKKYQRLSLYDLYPATKYPQYTHLFMDFDYDPCKVHGTLSLPGPIFGENVLEKHEWVELKIADGSNVFGDQYFTAVVGTLLLTDFRIIFLPRKIQAPHWIELSSSLLFNMLTSGDATSSISSITAEQKSLIRNLTLVLPLGGVQGISTELLDQCASTLSIESRDGSHIKFLLRTRNDGCGSNPNSNKSGSVITVDSRLNHLQDYVVEYNAGLYSDVIPPHYYATRLVDRVTWMLKTDEIWIKWGLAIKKTVQVYGDSSSSALWQRRLKTILLIDTDYQRILQTRYKAEASNWSYNDSNHEYKLCTTYPQSLLVPASLVEQDIVNAAGQRSRGRLAALVWLHPQTRVPLLRSSQPYAGITGINTAAEYDKKYLIAIKSSCPTGKPLRIADARPKINAYANASQGKGFENVGALGSNNASIHFLDIENIHAMRSSINKIREGLNNSLANSGTDPNECLHSSKWLQYIGTILKGASSIAESLLYGYPVLVHCSDGWDRTAQLTALTQLMIDPYYRTIEGFFALVHKEFSSFGHKFEDRLGKTGHKETAPIFLQFLDCVYQLTRQYPTAFEFTSSFLRIFANGCTAGCFSTFKCNSERDRNQLITDTIHSNKNIHLSTADMVYSSIYFYIATLLKCEVYHSVLVNNFYKPTKDVVKYIKPKVSAYDLVYWQEGLYNLYYRFIDTLHGIAPLLHECVASSVVEQRRINSYIGLHYHELSDVTRQRLEVIHSQGIDSLSPTRLYNTQYSSHVAPISIMNMRSFRGVVLCGPSTLEDKSKQSHALYHGDEEEINELEQQFIEAIVTVQLWYRAIRSASTAIQQYPSLTNELPLYRALNIIAISELKIARANRLMLLSIKLSFIASIVDDIFTSAMDRCMQIDDILLRNSSIAESTRYSSLSFAPTMSWRDKGDDASKGSNIKSSLTDMASRFGMFGGGKKAVDSAASSGPHELSKAISTKRLSQGAVPSSDQHRLGDHDKMQTSVAAKLMNMFSSNKGKRGSVGNGTEEGDSQHAAHRRQNITYQKKI